MQKVATCLAAVAVVCYSAVSPRTLPFAEYNAKFYDNLNLAALVVLPPLSILWFLFVDWKAQPSPQDQQQQQLLSSELQSKDRRHQTVSLLATPSTKPNNVYYDLVNAIYSSFIFGYLWAFAMEIVLTTLLRLAVFSWWEPDLFAGPGGSAPTSPTPPPWPILPWVLRDYKYRPKRITLLMADFVTSCVASPVVEEYVKLRILQWTIPLAKYVLPLVFLSLLPVSVPN